MPRFNYKKYVPTGNKAVDLVVACCSHNREHMLPIETIALRPVYYQQFTDYMRRIVPEEEQTGLYSFDSVNIEMGSVLQPYAISVKYYEGSNAQA